MLRGIPFLAINMALMAVLCILSGCESYDFTVNDKLVYTPKPLFSDFDTPDPALYDCIKQGIIDAKITGARQLTSLSCSHAGIENLQGLATFSGLTHLKLSSNKIRNLADLSAMTELQQLILDDNAVVDPVPLYRLPALRLLDLSENGTLQCPATTAFALVESLKLPRHCT